MNRRRWLGSVGKEDDYGVEITDTFIDGRTTSGPWAIMAPASFATYGVGLGIGFGQKYVKEDDGIFYKVEE